MIAKILSLLLFSNPYPAIGVLNRFLFITINLVILAIFGSFLLCCFLVVLLYTLHVCLIALGLSSLTASIILLAFILGSGGLLYWAGRAQFELLKNQATEPALAPTGQPVPLQILLHSFLQGFLHPEQK